MKLREFLKKKLTAKQMEKLKTSYDIVGSIAIIEIEPELENKEKVIAEAILELNRNIKTVAKKAGIHSGTFRTQKLRIIAGKRTKETIHKENNVSLKLHVEKVYFSARLSTERKRIMEMVTPNEDVLVMFSGCAPYVCVIAKNTGARYVTGIEINKSAHEYGLENLNMNKIKNAELIQGDVAKVVPKLKKTFDRILMPLPKSAEDFLGIALSAAKKGSIIHFYDFLHETEMPQVAYGKIERACNESSTNYRILNWNRCGQYSPGKFRICVDFMVE